MWFLLLGRFFAEVRVTCGEGVYHLGLRINAATGRDRTLLIGLLLVVVVIGVRPKDVLRDMPRIVRTREAEVVPLYCESTGSE